MRNTPKSNLEKLQQVTNAWETLAPNKSFGGMTLEQFKAGTAPSIAARNLIDDLEVQLTQALAARETADATTQTKIQLAVNGVLADPTEGPDSALYEAMGYTRKSERKSGLTHKKQGGKPPTT